jgi:thymidine kinase
MEVHHHVPEAPIMLVGTKADLRYEIFTTTKILINLSFYRDDPKTIQDLQSKGLAPITDEQVTIAGDEMYFVKNLTQNFSVGGSFS